jgi:hypothetical protein
MSLRRVTADTFVAWDGGWQPVQAGTIVDVPPGSVLEAVYGLSNLEDLSDPGAAEAAAAGAGVSN